MAFNTFEEEQQHQELGESVHECYLSLLACSLQFQAQRSAITIAKVHLHLALTDHITSPFTLFKNYLVCPLKGSRGGASVSDYYFSRYKASFHFAKKQVINKSGNVIIELLTFNILSYNR